MRQIKFRSWLIPENKMLNKFGIVYNNETSETERRVLMQYTGLKDKNGVEIFEGDVLLTEGYKNMVVRWNLELACFGVSFKNGATSNIPKDVEVIGNIYEHPHQLEVES